MKKITIFLVTLTVFAVGAFALPAVVGVSDSVQTPLETSSAMEVGNYLTLAGAHAYFAQQGMNNQEFDLFVIQIPALLNQYLGKS